MNLNIALLSAAILILLSAWDWRRSVKIALILAVIEGAIRKWVLPEASDLVYFVKDVVLLGAYLRYFVFDQTRSATEKFSGLKVLLWIATVIVILQVFNLRLGSVAVGVFGLKAYLWYVPLCFMARDLFHSAEELQTFLKWYLLLAIPVCSLGVLQFFSSYDSPINTYAGTSNAADVATFAVEGRENRARITGTFSYITGHATYLFICLSLIVPLLTSGVRKTWFVFAMAELALVAGNMFMSGSRGPVVMGVIFVACFLFFNRTAKTRNERSAVVPLVLAGAACVVVSMYWFDEAIDMFWARATNADDPRARVTSGFVEPFEYLLEVETEIAGYGAGATHPGGTALRRRMDLSDPPEPPPAAEAETFRVLLELGLFGFVVWYGMRLYLIWALWRTWRQLQSQFLKHLAFAAFSTHMLQLPSAVVLNHTLGVYFWFMAGFIYLLPQLEAMALQRSPVNPNVVLGPLARRLRDATSRV
jgi:hypothetical protein